MFPLDICFSIELVSLGKDGGLLGSSCCLTPNEVDNVMRKMSLSVQCFHYFDIPA